MTSSCCILEGHRSRCTEVVTVCVRFLAPAAIGRRGLRPSKKDKSTCRAQTASHSRNPSRKSVTQEQDDRDLDVDFNELVEISEDRPGKDKAYQISGKKIYKDLGWSPKVSLDKGLEETIDWVKHNWGTVKKLPIDYIHKA